MHQTKKGPPLCRRYVVSPGAGTKSVGHPGRDSLPVCGGLFSWLVAPNNGKPEKEQPVTLARMLAAQNKDQPFHDLRDKMDQNERSRFPETKEGLLVRVAPLEGAIQVYVPFILGQDQGLMNLPIVGPLRLTPHWPF